MDEIEIICIVKDRDGLVSHCGVKGYGVQDILIIEKLIREEVVLFLSMKETKKRGMYMQELNGKSFLTTDPNGSDMNTLDILPLFDRPLLRRLIKTVR